MLDRHSLKIPRELIEQIEKGNCVPFLGAGVSISEGGIPSGSQLAQELVERAELWDLEGQPLPVVAQAYAIEKGRRSLNEYLDERINDPQYRPLEAHHLIAAMPFDVVITTNWDNLLEQALDQAGKKDFARVIRDTDLSYAGSKMVLIKLHGTIDDKESLLVTEDDFEDFFAKRSQIANALSHYAATKTLLFLGYSLADADFKRIHAKVVRNLREHKRRAYAVLRNPSKSTVEIWRGREVQIIDAGCR